MNGYGSNGFPSSALTAIQTIRPRTKTPMTAAS